MSVPSFPAVAALVRAVSPRLAEAELTHLDRRPIDLARARAQHAAYGEVLRSAGLELVAAPEAPEHPDGVFVEDVVVMLGEVAVLTRPGAPSRRGELAGLDELLRARGLEVVTLEGPGTLDGGDVLQVGDTVHVGLTTRTDAAGAAALGRVVAELDRRLVTVPVTGALHLKTAATALPDGTIVAVPGQVDPASFGDLEVVAAPEPAGADLLLLGGGEVVLSAAAARTADLVAARGFTPRPVDISELEKAEAGPTCLSVLLPR